MGRKKVWGEVENNYIIENAGHMKDADLAAKLSQLVNRAISVQSLRKQRQKLHVLKKAGRGKCELRPTQTNQVHGLTATAVIIDEVHVGAPVVDVTKDIVWGPVEGSPFAFTPNPGDTEPSSS